MSPFVPLFPSSISFPFLCCKSHLRAFVCYIRQDTRIRGWGVKPIFPLPAFSENLAMHSLPQKKSSFQHILHPLLLATTLYTSLSSSSSLTISMTGINSNCITKFCHREMRKSFRNRGQKDFQVVTGFFPGPILEQIGTFDFTKMQNFLKLLQSGNVVILGKILLGSCALHLGIVVFFFVFFWGGGLNTGWFGAPI